VPPVSPVAESAEAPLGPIGLTPGDGPLAGRGLPVACTGAPKWGPLKAGACFGRVVHGSTHTALVEEEGEIVDGGLPLPELRGDPEVVLPSGPLSVGGEGSTGSATH